MRNINPFPYGDEYCVRPMDTITKMDLTAAAGTSGGTIYLPLGQDNAVNPGFDVLAIGFNLTVGDTPDTAADITTAGILGLYALYGATPTALLVTSLYGVPTPSTTSQYYPPGSTFFGYPSSTSSPALVNPTLPTYPNTTITNWPGFQVEANMDLSAANANAKNNYPAVWPVVGNTIVVGGVTYPVYALQFQVQTQGVSSDSGHQYVYPYAILRRRQAVGGTVV